MPVYEYRCQECGRRSSALLGSWSAPDPPCPHCGAGGLQRLVSTFAAPRLGSSDLDHADFGEDAYGDEDGMGGDDDFGGGGFDDDF